MSGSLDRVEKERVARVYSNRGYDTDPEYSDSNPVYLQRVQSIERHYLKALSSIGVGDLSQQEILDYGCGNGRWLGRWLAWGADPQRLRGIDIREAAAATARSRFPGCEISTIDQARLPYGDDRFNVISSIVVFSSILDGQIRQQVASEILRVLAPGGALLLCDFSVDNPTNKEVRAVRRSQVHTLFGGAEVRVFSRLVLAPPIARRIVPKSWTLADLVEAIIVPVRTHRLYIIRKPH